jgi:hypothetical protein
MKVTLEVLADEYIWKVIGEEGNIIAQRTMKRSERGWKGTEKEHVFSDALEEASLYGLEDAIEECGFGPSEIANALE